MIRPAPASKDQILKDEKFLLEVSSSSPHLDATSERLYNMAWRLLAALKHEQGQRMAPVLDAPPREQISDLEEKRRKLETKLGAKISWMEILSNSVPVGWGESVGILWEEDECLRRDETAPHLSWALHRFAGFHSLEELGAKIDGIDNGDSGLDLYPGGWIRLWSYNGDGLGRVYRVIQSDDQAPEAKRSRGGL